jgi:hypothetical protein
MRYMQVLTLALLTVIAVELGVIAVRAPVPASAQSADSVILALGGVSTQLTAIQNNLNKTYTKLNQLQQTENSIYNNLNDDSKRLLALCFMDSETFGSTFHPLYNTTSAGSLARCTLAGWNGYGFLQGFNIRFEK